MDHQRKNRRINAGIPKERSHMRLFAGALLLALVCIVSFGMPAASADTEPRDYVALGDSFSSGEGLDSYDETNGGNPKVHPCHRSVLAYPRRLEQRNSAELSLKVFAACSGATTRDVFWKQYNNQPPQLNLVNPSTEVITLTLGGNDIGFQPIITDCVFTTLPANAGGKVSGRPGCKGRNRDTVNAKLKYFSMDRKQNTAEFSPNMPLELVLKRLHDKAPNAEIFVAGYPQMINPVNTVDVSYRQIARPACRVGTAYTRVAGGVVPVEVPLFITASDAEWIHQTATKLNGGIADVVTRAARRGIPARFVNVAPLFEGQLVCETAEPLVNGVVLPPGVTDPEPASFHPTIAGQNQYWLTMTWAILGAD